MTYGIASVFPLEALVGKRVVALRDFSGIPAGTVGTVDEHYGKGQRHQGIMVSWTTSGGSDVRDGFGRDEDVDETQYLAVIE